MDGEKDSDGEQDGELWIELDPGCFAGHADPVRQSTWVSGGLRACQMACLQGYWRRDCGQVIFGWLAFFGVLSTLTAMIARP